MNFTKNRPWIAYVDDERDLDHGVIVTLKDGWFFKADPRCGTYGFDTLAEAKQGTTRNQVYESA